MKHILFLIAGIVTADLAFAQIRLEDLELTPYKALRSEGNYEERQYEAKNWACHSKTKKEFISRFMETQYFELYRYISGENDQAKRIAMTAPVTMQYTKNRKGSEVSELCFYIPEKFQDNPPKPINKEIYIKKKPAFTVLVRTFTGLVNTREGWEKEAEVLKKDLEDSKESNVNYDFYIAAAYDAPTKQNIRRNEIWYLKE